MSESESKPIKTRWSLMIGIFFGVFVLPLAIILALAWATSDDNKQSIGTAKASA